jgi:uncharacterized YigZ family protein
MNDAYRTLTAPARIKVPVGACRFIASLAPAASEAEARGFIDGVAREYSDATHHAYAYKLGHGDAALRRSSDAGEPAGTAGLPMLEVLDKYNLTLVVLVGTRYFGGVKLGVGGLIRAYRLCAEEGVKAARIETRHFTRVFGVQADYRHVGSILRELEAFQGTVRNIQYGAQVKVTAAVRAKYAGLFQKRLLEVTRGQVKIDPGRDG